MHLETLRTGNDYVVGLVGRELDHAQSRDTHGAIALGSHLVLYCFRRGHLWLRHLSLCRLGAGYAAGSWLWLYDCWIGDRHRSSRVPGCIPLDWVFGTDFRRRGPDPWRGDRDGPQFAPGEPNHGTPAIDNLL